LKFVLFRSKLFIIVKVLLKKILVGPLLGEIGLFCVYSDYAEQRIFCKLGKKNFNSQISNVPFIFANYSFPKI
jgi:hypothetical protein